MPTLTDETAEAICGALHQTEFRFLYEQLPTTYWTVGESPKAMRVAVVRDIDRVRVDVEWANISAPPRVVRTRVQLAVDCSKGRTHAETATGQLVYRIMEMYLDVLRGVGVAGPEYLKRQINPPS